VGFATSCRKTTFPENTDSYLFSRKNDADYHAYIDSQLPSEAPTLYRMHANAEIEVLTKMSDYLFRCLLAGQQTPQRIAGPGMVGEDDKQLNVVEDMLERVPEPFNMAELYHRAEERTPFTNVALQECELMNKLTVEVVKLLKELSQGWFSLSELTTDGAFAKKVILRRSQGLTHAQHDHGGSLEIHCQQRSAKDVGKILLPVAAFSFGLVRRFAPENQATRVLGGGLPSASLSLAGRALFTPIFPHRHHADDG
jgi:hypothetical protein